MLKRILIALLTSVVMIEAQGTTLVPVQALNPTGSNSGQAIVSTGGSSAPAWGGIGVNGIAAIAANTVLANATGSSASPTALAVPSCSTSSSALNWTTSGGATALSCNTAINAATLGGTAAASYALLASPTFTGTPAAPTASAGTNTTQLATTAYVQTALTGGSNSASLTTLTTSGALTPSGGIVASTAGTQPAAGQVGNVQKHQTTGTSLTAGTPTNADSLLLPAGNWNVQCSMQFTGAGTTASAAYWNSVSTTSNTLGSGFTNTSYLQTPSVTQAIEQFSSPMVDLSFSTPTTVYCVAEASISGGTMTVNGQLWATRRP